MRVTMLVVSVGALLAVVWCCGYGIEIVRRDESRQWMVYPIAITTVVLGLASLAWVVLGLEERTRPRA